MKKIFITCLALCLFFISGCQNEKDKLVKAFPDQENEINNLSEQELSEYYDLFKNDETITFNELSLKYLLNNENSNKQMVSYINNALDTFNNNTNSEFTLEDYTKLSETTCIFNVYFNGLDTNLTMAYGLSDDDCALIIQAKGGYSNIDVSDLIVFLTSSIATIDTSLKEDGVNAMNLVYKVIAEGEYAYNDHVYSCEIDELESNITFAIL